MGHSCNKTQLLRVIQRQIADTAPQLPRQANYSCPNQTLRALTREGYGLRTSLMGVLLFADYRGVTFANNEWTLQDRQLRLTPAAQNPHQRWISSYDGLFDIELETAQPAVVVLRCRSRGTTTPAQSSAEGTRHRFPGLTENAPLICDHPGPWGIEFVSTAPIIHYRARGIFLPPAARRRRME